MNANDVVNHRKSMVCGFMFSESRQFVGLLLKDCAHKPSQAWQHGKLNGVGGHVEVGENHRAAMVREFHEETGVATGIADWELFATWKAKGGEILFYRAFSDKVFDMKQVERERPVVYPVDSIPVGTGPVPNLRMLIPIALSDEAFTEPVRFRTL